MEFACFPCGVSPGIPVPSRSPKTYFTGYHNPVNGSNLRLDKATVSSLATNNLEEGVYC